jgi:hypothetical protein
MKEKIRCEYCRSAERKQKGDAGTCQWTLAPHCERCCQSICEPNWKPLPLEHGDSS